MSSGNRDAAVVVEEATSSPIPSAAQEWRAHWPMVLAAFIGISLPIVPFFALGLFIDPLVKEFGWSRTLIGAGTSIAAAVVVPASPLIGALIDRWGVRWPSIIGLTLTAISIACLSLSNGSPVQWLALWSCFAISSAFLKSTVWTTAINRAFHAGRSLALAVMLAGVTLANTAAPPLARWLTDTYGWREAFFWLGTGWGLPAIILAVLFMRDIGGNASASGSVGAAKAARPVLPGLSIPEALRCLALWRIGLATLLTLLFSTTLVIHKVPLLMEVGVTRESAAWLTGLSGLAGLAGLLVTGWLMDRFDAGWVGGLTNGAMALSLLVLLEPFRSPTLIVISMLVAGYAGGTKLQISAFLTARYAGLRNYGKIYGIIGSFVAATGAVGPIFGGLMYDATGSYTLLILSAIPASAMAGLLLIRLGPYPDWARQAGSGSA